MPRATLANAMTGRRTHASNATTSRSVMIAGRNGYCTLQVPSVKTTDPMRKRMPGLCSGCAKS